MLLKCKVAGSHNYWVQDKSDQIQTDSAEKCSLSDANPGR